MTAAKLGIQRIFINFSKLLPLIQQSQKWKWSNTSQKSWSKNFSNEYIYAEQNPNRIRDIRFQSWPCRSQKWYTISLKFWLWRQVPENWQAIRTFSHPISHCNDADYWRILFFNNLHFNQCFSKSPDTNDRYDVVHLLVYILRCPQIVVGKSSVYCLYYSSNIVWIVALFHPFWISETWFRAILLFVSHDFSKM